MPSRVFLPPYLNSGLRRSLGYEGDANRILRETGLFSVTANLSVIV